MCHLKNNQFSLGNYPIGRTWRFDTVHVAKGVFESTVSTLFDIPNKIKDGLRTRRDLQKFRIKPQLHPQ
jgi:hypothetical protein